MKEIEDGVYLDKYGNKRNKDGTFAKGYRPVSDGRPRGVRKRAKEACEKFGVDPLFFMAELLADKEASNKDKLTAAKELCDRIWGKAIQQTINETNVTTNNEVSEAVKELIDAIKKKD